MTLMEEMRALSKKVEDLENEARSNHHESQEFLKLVHCNTLDEWSNQHDPSRPGRNNAVHGGNVRTDIAVTKEYDRHPGNNNKTVKWKYSFYRQYGIPFRYADQILASPLDFRSVLNKRASVLSLKTWATPQNQHRADAIIIRADKLIRLWRGAGRVSRVSHEVHIYEP